MNKVKRADSVLSLDEAINSLSLNKNKSSPFTNYIIFVVLLLFVMVSLFLVGTMGYDYFVKNYISDECKMLAHPIKQIGY